MREFTKPLVVVSKCIEFEPVRWDGRIIASEFVKAQVSSGIYCGLS